MTQTRQWYYHGTSGKRWRGIQMRSAFALLPIYLTTDKKRAEHYARARAAKDEDTEYAIVGVSLPPHAVEVDTYSTKEPDQFIRWKPISQATFYSRHLTAEVMPLVMAEGEKIFLQAYCVGMNWGDDRRFAPGFESLNQAGGER